MREGSGIDEEYLRRQEKRGVGLSERAFVNAVACVSRRRSLNHSIRDGRWRRFLFLVSCFSLLGTSRIDVQGGADSISDFC